MTEEEKKAIKGLEWSQKQMRLGNLPDYDQGHYADIRVALNLIEKQQKEIEQLANGIRVLGTNPDITTEEIIKEFTEKPISEEYMEEFKSRYISKDKIREIIAEEFIMYDAFYRIKKLVEE